jgi:hypothetical protein
MKWLLLILLPLPSFASSFSESYLAESEKGILDETYIDSCLEKSLLGENSESICLEAVQSLTQKPLNAQRREILFFLLTKLQTGPVKKKFYSSFRQGLLGTHPEISPKELKVKVLIPGRAAKLDLKAWKKALVHKEVGSDFVLLMNGKTVPLNSNWAPPEGIFQWSLVTDRYDPLIRLSSFSQFAKESIQNLKEVSVNLATTPAIKEVPTLPKLEPIAKNRNWLWPVIAIVGIGIAGSLRGKNVSVSMPSFR